MASPRAPERPSAGRRRVTGPAVPQGADAVVTARDLLLKSWAGRLFIISAALKVIVAIARVVGELPGFLQVVSVAASIGLAVSIGHFVWRLFVLVKRRLLWRVRRKLILSYIFIGSSGAADVASSCSAVSHLHQRQRPFQRRLRRRDDLTR